VLRGPAEELDHSRSCDGAYAGKALRHLPRQVTVTTRLRADAALYQLPAPRRPGQRGRTPARARACPTCRLPERDPSGNDGSGAYRLTVKDVPVDGFWSVSVYDAEGHFVTNDRDAYALNSVTAIRAPDGR
jgi:Protein of unknown function (DUF1214)